jgi:Fur family transcriptional regulator, zinc uptake regulator
MARPSKLPVHPSKLVLGLLKCSKHPLTAYNLLEKLKKHGVQGPPVIYRALKQLMDKGQIHRIQALNAYVACGCEAGHHHEFSVLTVCKGCKTVDEMHDHAVIRYLAGLRRLGINVPKAAVVELPVVCQDCAT